MPVLRQLTVEQSAVDLSKKLPELQLPVEQSAVNLPKKLPELQLCQCLVKPVTVGDQVGVGTLLYNHAIIQDDYVVCITYS